jgi:hypothetical protein
MAESMKGKAVEAGHKIAEAATTVGHKVSEAAEKATDWVKEKAHEVGHRAEEVAQKVRHKTEGTCGAAKTTADIREHMEVFGSCGNKLGLVDGVEGSSIKLTKNDSPDGLHHYVPLSWVGRVDEHVHLTKNCGEAKREWQAAPIGAGAG